MSTRRITRRQADRIKHIQEQRKARVTKKSQLEETQLGPEQLGLLITRYGKMAEIEDEKSNVINAHYANT